MLHDIHEPFFGSYSIWSQLFFHTYIHDNTEWGAFWGWVDETQMTQLRLWIDSAGWEPQHLQWFERVSQMLNLVIVLRGKNVEVNFPVHETAETSLGFLHRVCVLQQLIEESRSNHLLDLFGGKKVCVTVRPATDQVHQNHRHIYFSDLLQNTSTPTSYFQIWSWKYTHTYISSVHALL